MLWKLPVHLPAPTSDPKLLWKLLASPLSPPPPTPPLPQIGSCTSQMGQIAIVSFQSSSPKVIECFNVESRTLCMVFIPAEPGAAAGRAPGVPTICLGTEEGR